MTQEEQDILCKYVSARYDGFSERVDLHFIELEKRMVLIAEAQQRALELSTRINDERLKGMNEWRGTVEDILATTVRREEFILHTENQRRELDVFLKFKEERVSVPADIDNLKKDIRNLNTFKDKSDGFASQKNLVTVTVISAIGLFTGIIGVILRLLGL